MHPLLLHEFHHDLAARFAAISGTEIVTDYGDEPAEHAALTQGVGVLDFGFRSRLCLVGADRARFLHGQVTNDVKKLRVGEGCYAAITTAKGKMESDLNIFCLKDELLLDFEPGLTEKISQRLEKYIVADDVQILDVGAHYGLWTVQGPQAEALVRALGWFSELPGKPLASASISDGTLGEVYIMQNARVGTTGFDLFVPNAALALAAGKLAAAAKATGGRFCGWQAFETVRIEAGIPRYGADMDETNIPLECGLEGRAITYTKGCYIGQEVINRIHSVGHVNRELRGLRLANGITQLPRRGDKLVHAGKEAGYITSAVQSPGVGSIIALGYVRREANEIGTELTLQSDQGGTTAKIVPLPFK